ncbi:putative protein kinase RLK-Pelle-LRR-XI-1 family [Dioscorea sansibarensis]
MATTVGKWRRALLSFTLILFLSKHVSAIDNQGAALLDWKRTLNGSLEALSDWNPNDPTPCQWSGVSCNAENEVMELTLQYMDLFGRVPSNLTSLSVLTKLVLSGTNLTGLIPPQLGDLPRLIHLDLSGNALTGVIPDGLCRPGSQLEKLFINSNRLEGPIPDSIGNLLALKSFMFYDNQLEGPIPSSVGRLANLEVVRGGGNKNLRGPLPAEIGNCSSLVMLGLAETSISGPLPRTLGQLQKLETLAVYTAMLTGPIPAELGQCAQLQNIYLYENSLSGSIPSSLGNLEKLQNLLLWQNSLVGLIPPELGRCRELALVDLSMNSLTGPIPPALGNVTALQELQLSMNQISGTIPVELAKCGNLTDLELDNNLISGGIPQELGRLGNLRMLYLWQNKLEGNIPAEIGNCANLEAMDLSQNGLTGPIPRGIFALPRLGKLLLLGNELSGIIPPEIGNCSSLIRFRANGNHLAGPIPPEIGSLKNLSFLDLGSNRLVGPIPSEIAGCRNLTFLDLHSNSIAGNLPDNLFDGLVFLQFLDLSNNSIAGPLPQNLGMLTSLTKLILSGNKFSGRIPQEIGSCGRLQLLDLSNNELSNDIPATIGGIPALEIALNLSCNDLSGDIPAEFAGLARLGVLDLSHNRLSGDLKPLAGLQNLVALNLSYNNFSGSVPEGPFFSKLPVGDLEGNPALCLSRCSTDSTNAGATRRAARIAAVVLLSAAAALLSVAGFLFLNRKRRTRGSQRLEDEEKEGEMGPPWEVTLYQKLEIGVADVARNLSSANIIGRGWSGVVYKARVPSSGTIIAVKRFKSADETAIAAFASEIGALARVRHRNIVRLLGWATNRRTRLLFYDYMPNGTLGELLHGGGGVAAGWDWEVRLGIAVGVAEGLAYLHHDCVPGILHRDVKAENVLLGECYEACLADFGLARVVEDGVGGNSTPPPFAGSYGYIAPEYGCMMKITRKSDVYSFGVLLLEMITGKKPVDPSFQEGQNVIQWVREHLRAKRDPAEVVDPRLQGRPDTQVQEMLQALGIALLCASNRAEDRPTMKDVAALLRGIRHDEPQHSGEARKPSSTVSCKRSEPVARSPARLDVPSLSPHCSLAYSSSASDNFK